MVSLEDTTAVLEPLSVAMILHYNKLDPNQLRVRTDERYIPQQPIHDTCAWSESIVLQLTNSLWYPRNSAVAVAVAVVVRGRAENVTPL